MYIYIYLCVCVYLYIYICTCIAYQQNSRILPIKSGSETQKCCLDLLGFLLQVSQVVDRDCGGSYLETSRCLQTSRSKCLLPTAARFFANHRIDGYTLCISFNLCISYMYTLLKLT